MECRNKMQPGVVIGLPTLLVVVCIYVVGISIPQNGCPLNHESDVKSKACIKFLERIDLNNYTEGTLEQLDNTLALLLEKKNELQALENDEDTLESKHTSSHVLELMNEISTPKFKVAIMAARTEEKDKEIRQLEETLSELNTTLGTRIERKESYILDLVNEINVLNSRVTIIAAKTEEKDAKIRQLEETIATLNKNISNN